MRSDMAKVLVERPRFGSRSPNGPGKGAKRRLARAMASDDGPPIRERMPRFLSKHFNEHLGPLRRFLRSHTGRPWAAVYAEISEHVRPTSVIQSHILTHLFQYVATAVRLIDGRPCNPATGTPLADRGWGPDWYVCPRTGLLRAVARPPRRVARQRRREQWDDCRQPPAYVIPVGRTLQCHGDRDRWELVTVAPLPILSSVRVWDVVRERRVGVGDEEAARGLYGAAVYATTRRPLAKAELWRYPIPLDLLTARRQPDRVPRR